MERLKCVLHRVKGISKGPGMGENKTYKRNRQRLILRIEQRGRLVRNETESSWQVGTVHDMLPGGHIWNFNLIPRVPRSH